MSYRYGGHGPPRGSGVRICPKSPRARNCSARGKPEDLQVIALNIDDDVGRTARGSILDVEISSRIQRADEGTVLRCTGHNRDHSAHWRIGRADQNIATGASGIWISDAPDNGVCICRNRVAAHRHAADLVGSGSSAIEMLARVGVAAAGPGIDKTRGRGKDRLRAWTRGAGRTGCSGRTSCPIPPVGPVGLVASAPVPSWPFASMKTGLPLLLSTPFIPATKVAVCCMSPMRM